MELAIAGQVIKKAFAPQPNLVETFTWDGKDGYGRTLQGIQTLSVRIGYEYVAQYYFTEDTYEASFNRFGLAPIATSASGVAGAGVSFSFLGARTETPPIVLWQDYGASLGTLGSLGLGGWNLSVHHTYDFGGRTIYLGNGDQRSAKAAGAVITTAAGIGERAVTGDGGPAIQARLADPYGVATAPDGSVYVADTSNHRVRRIRPDGIITTVAGKGSSTELGGFSGDGGPATQAELRGPRGVAVGPDGSLYIADTNNSRIRRVGPDGIISTLAGTGIPGGEGDGGPAAQARLYSPSDVAVGPDGSLYIADTYNSRVRRVGPDGIIVTVAGTGIAGFGGDGGPATQARISYTTGIAVGSDGSLYIADSSNQRVRRVGPDGIIKTVAGNGAGGFQGAFAGDGGPATLAGLRMPSAVALSADGSIYIADTENQRIRRVGPEGVIMTVAGKDNPDGLFFGDGGPATQAGLYYPRGLAVAPNGDIYVANPNQARIRRITTSFPGLGTGNIAVASENGDEIYIFDVTGRHLRTLDALTGTVRHQFSYNSAGLLTSITDGDGNVTRIERNGSGSPSAIVAPGGQRTIL
ncbi:MAG: hypothetical protein ACK2UB_06580, partial [Anaerolineales bacterium]